MVSAKAVKEAITMPLVEWITFDCVVAMKIGRWSNEDALRVKSLRKHSTKELVASYALKKQIKAF
jgi:hypothetical protein